MINQNIMFRFAITLMRNHPEMHDDFMNMSQLEVAEFVHDNYGVVLTRGTSWEDVSVIINVMNKMHEAKNSA